MRKHVEIFKALGQSTRMKILKALAEADMCVCELEEVLEMNQPRISQHLKILREAGLVSERSEGPWRIYSLDWTALKQEFNGFTDFLHQPLSKTEGFEKESKNLGKIGNDLRIKKCQR